MNVGFVYEVDFFQVRVSLEDLLESLAVSAAPLQDPLIVEQISLAIQRTATKTEAQTVHKIQESPIRTGWQVGHTHPGESVQTVYRGIF